MSKSYILVCKSTNRVKCDGDTGVLLIFDTLRDATKARKEYPESYDVKIVECDMSFDNQIVVS